MSDARCCYVASVAEFLDETKPVWLAKMKGNFPRVCPNLELGASQVSAWEDCFRVLKAQLALSKELLNFQIIFEYALPYEDGRRPDVILLSKEQVLVLEFKRYAAISTAAEDQVKAYARDLGEYHFASREREIVPVLVLTRLDAVEIKGDVLICGKNDLAAKLQEVVKEVTPCDASIWLASKYEPLPALVEAAKMFMQNAELPNIRRAASAGINDGIKKLLEITSYARENAKHVLALVTGVPGAGKTYLGLQFVYDACKDIERVNSVYLSGNGPLVEVLTDALKSRVFVKSLHKQLGEYLRNGARDFSKNIIVFDEGQRAWDQKKMNNEGRGSLSEPEVMVELTEKRLSWCVLLILVGEGQEIHNGENSGLGQWNVAINNSEVDWVVACPDKLLKVFEGQKIYGNRGEALLDLTKSLRSHLAGEVSDFIKDVIDGKLIEAKKYPAKIYSQGFDMYITRDLESAKEYCRQRYDNNDKARYGLIASSKAFVGKPSYGLNAFGVDNTYSGTRNTKYGPWFNAPKGTGYSCCDFQQVVTEFACQGLELDLPIVCWGEDMVWNGSRWDVYVAKRGKAESDIKDALDYRINSYRVLLTRGRDGFIVFVPGSSKLDSVYGFFKEAGVKELKLAKDQ